MDSNAKGVPEATPRPWSIDDRRGAPLRNVRILGADKRDIAWLSQVHTRDKMLYQRKDCSSGWTDEQANAQDANALADAELIVTAVNSFDALQAANKLLREACEAALATMYDKESDVAKQLRQALRVSRTNFDSTQATHSATGDVSA